MIARSAAWSAAVAKFARPRLRVTMAVSPIAMASPTAAASSAARRARSAKRVRSRELDPASGIDRAEYADAIEEIVEVKGLRDHVLDATPGELVLELVRRRTHEEHRHVPDVSITPDAVVHLETA